MTKSELPSSSLPEPETGLVALALEQLVAARAACLEALCGEDKALRARLSGGTGSRGASYPACVGRLVGDDTSDPHHGQDDVQDVHAELNANNR